MTLIDKGALFNALASAQDKGDIFAVIQGMPEAVVRCKDCIHYSEIGGFCKSFKGMSGSESPEDYCSYGKRRTNA